MKSQFYWEKAKHSAANTNTKTIERTVIIPATPLVAIHVKPIANANIPIVLHKANKTLIVLYHLYI